MPIELTEFRKSLCYTIQSPIANIATDLQELEKLDQLAENKQKEYGKKSLYYFLGAITSIILIFVLSITGISDSLLGLIGILLFLVIIGLIFASIYALIKRSKFKRLNLNNYRYQLVKNILQMLSRDMDKTAVVDLQLSFQPIDKKEHKTSEIPHPQKSGWKIDTYQHEWVKIKGQFLDKTRFELTATGISKKQYGWKRGRSGKSKYKSKTKSGGLDINLSLIYPVNRYGAVKILQNEVSSAVKLPEFSQLRNLRVTDKAIQITARILPQVAENNQQIYQAIAGMFLSSYQILNLAKMLSK